MDKTTIGRYEIVGELGRGGMGVVYRAVDPTIRRTIALKTLRLDSQADKPEDVLRRFRHEAQLAGGMNHPNIVTIYDAGDDGSIFYIAMEFIEGRTLQAILAEQRIPLTGIMDVSRQLCSALDYAHQRGVVHRDIKPANVMGASLNALKIMDFGIAKSDLGLTMTGQILGTPAYMSPEQVMGRPLDGRSDLFSFAVMLYQMVTGEMPFPGTTATTIIYKIANEHPTAPSDLDVTIHPGLSAVITKALAKNPDDRFQSGAELVKALENYKAQPIISRQSVALSEAPTVTMLGQPETTRLMPASPSVPGIAAASPGQSRSWLLILAVAVLSVLAALYFGVVKRAQGPATQTIASPAQTSTPQPPPQAGTKIEESSVPPAKPVPEFAELHVTSDPPGATVSIDGKTEDSWTTPFTAKRLRPGTHQISFSRQGYVDQTRSAKLTPGELAHVSAQLVMSGGTLVLNSDPSGAVIFIDGKKLQGQVTPTQLHVDAGEHKVMLRMPGYQEENTTVEIKDGETYPYSPTLERGAQQKNAGAGSSMPNQMNPQQQERFKKALQDGKGIIAVFTEPAGASITINGRLLPQPTPFRVPVNPGDYRVTIALEGYTTVQRQITVEAGKPSRIQVRLAPR